MMTGKDTGINKRKRIIWVDLCRILATWGVICIHVRGQEYYILEKGNLTWNIVLLWGTLFMWSVPLFLMLSGMLMLDREISLGVIVKKIIRLMAYVCIDRICFCIVAVVICIYERDLSYDNFRILARETGPVYFLFLLSGLYIITPLLNCICKERKWEEYFIVLCFSFSVCIPLLERFPYISAVVAAFSEYIYMPLGCTIYYVLGHYIAKYYFNNFYSKKKFVIIGMCICVLVYIALSFGMEYFPGHWWALLKYERYPYVSIAIIGMSIFVFLYFGIVVSRISIRREWLQNLISHLGKNTIVIYILHYPFWRILWTAGIHPLEGYYVWGGVLMETTIIFLAGYLISLIGERMPIINKLF